MPPYELIQPYTVQSWVVKNIVGQIVENFDVVDDKEVLYLYWTDKARTYDGINWNNPNEELGFWLQVVYKLADEHYDTGLFHNVKRVIVKPMRFLYGLDKKELDVIG